MFNHWKRPAVRTQGVLLLRFSVGFNNNGQVPSKGHDTGLQRKDARIQGARSYCSSSNFLSTPVPEVSQMDPSIKSYSDLYNFSIQKVRLLFAVPHLFIIVLVTVIAKCCL